MRRRAMALAAGFLCAASTSVFAQSAGPGPGAAGGTVSAGDTAWVLLGAALVMFMTPGLAFFYGGLVRKKNVLSVLMQCVAALCIISVQWVLLGYTLSFGPDKHGLIGGLEWAWLRGVGQAPAPAYSATVPHLAFMIFQGMFAAITPALIAGAFAERMRFTVFCAFTLLWTTFVYDPVAHWVWGDGGFLRCMGALDFAGGAVVHVNAGVAALVAAVMLRRRLNRPGGMSPPHNLPLAVLGAGMLWFGWFGFNAGSALGAGGLAASALTATNLAAAAAGVAWAVLDRVFSRTPTTLGAITGAVAGLVAVTPACGFIKPVDGIWVGVGAAAFCYFFVSFVKPRLGYDDTLDAFGVHGIGGIWGSLATGIWASKDVNPAGADGLLHGNPGLLLVQLKATAITAAFSLVMTFLIMKALDLAMGLRVSEDEERVGLDLTQHSEAGYTMLE